MRGTDAHRHLAGELVDDADPAENDQSRENSAICENVDGRKRQGFNSEDTTGSTEECIYEQDQLNEAPWEMLKVKLRDVALPAEAKGVERA
ncbi:hypothetical protein PoB_002887800 [Plakobranchus ocellatus]|uniref:Uncharacterized protein n=1 Tax=Plakobranchus ocellatus TaxID=259542 RepID=A0AAV4A6L9_9GAST|nr:hypothetical protein PoB_002887800 [Plakobranchus ocellatus]